MDFLWRGVAVIIRSNSDCEVASKWNAAAVKEEKDSSNRVESATWIRNIKVRKTERCGKRIMSYSGGKQSHTI